MIALMCVCVAVGLAWGQDKDVDPSLGFTYGDSVVVAYQGSDQNITLEATARKLVGLPGQKLLPSLDADFSGQNGSAWQWWGVAEDSVLFCSGAVPSRTDSAKYIPSAQVLLALRLSAWNAAASLPDSTFFIVSWTGLTLPADEKGITWGKIHYNRLTKLPR